MTRGDKEDAEGLTVRKSPITQILYDSEDLTPSKPMFSTISLGFLSC